MAEKLISDKPTYEELKKRVNVLEQSELEYELANEALRKNEIQNRLITDNVSDLIWTIDIAQRFTYFSPAILKFRGYTPEEALQIPIENTLTPESYKKAVSAIMEEIAAEGKPGVAPDRSQTLEFEHIRKDGSTIWGEVTTSFIRNEDGLPSGIIGITRDITERKQAEEALRASEEKYCLIFDNAPLGILHFNKKGIITSCNDKLVKIIGSSREKLIGLNMLNHPDDHVVSSVKQSLGGKPAYYEGDYHSVTAKKVTQARMLFEPIISQDKSVSGGVGIIEDITERKQAEEKLLESEQFMFSVFESIQDGISILNTDLSIRHVNGIMKKWYSENLPFEGKKCFECYHNADKPCTPCPSLRCLESGKTEMDIVPGLPNSDAEWVELYSYPIRRAGSEKITGIVEFVRDITKRKQAEEALWKSEKKYRNILENIDDGYFEVDLSGNFSFFNDIMCKKIGYAKNDLIGTNSQKYMNKKNAKHIFQAFNKVYQTGMPTKALEIQYIKKDGSKGFVEMVVSLITDSNNKGIGFRGIARDIAGRKQLEAQLHQARKMESIGTLAGGIAHDFNNLLYMITGNAELALDDIPKWNPAHDNLKEIQAAGMRAAGIVKQLLNFSRKIDQELKPISAITIIKDALKFLRSMIPSSIEICKHLPLTEVSILADPVQINQVLMNICTNASQAMEKTGGNITINVEIESLTDDAADNYPDLSSGKYVKIAVTDTGPGIDSKIIDRIFDPYFTTKKVGKGSGMGLAVVVGIIKNHGGCITVDSQPGKGATFTIFFPVTTENSVIAVKAPDELLLGNETILFVDDEESIAIMTQNMLERLGYTVETETNPSAAFKLFQSKPDAFDLVITDMTMPQMNGVTLSEKLKTVRSDIPVIICTGHSSLIDEETASEMGIAAYVMKPIRIRDIAKTIRQVLDD